MTLGELLNNLNNIIIQDSNRINDEVCVYGSHDYLRNPIEEELPYEIESVDDSIEGRVDLNF